MNNTKIFLKNEEIMRKIIRAAELDKSSSIVWEIGAGDGRLTRFIAEAAKKVYAVEKDIFWLDAAKSRLSGFDNITFIQGDALKIDISDDVNRIISNLPYAISSPITERILYFMNKHQDSFAVLMYQKEFADRMLAFPGLHEYSMLSVFVQYLCTVEKIADVSRVNFKQMQEVDSSIVRLKPKNVEIDESFLGLSRLLFQHKNKNLYSAIIDSRHKLGIKSKEGIREKISGMDESLLNKKVFSLGIDDLFRVYTDLKKRKIW